MLFCWNTHCIYFNRHRGAGQLFLSRNEVVFIIMFSPFCVEGESFFSQSRYGRTNQDPLKRKRPSHRQVFPGGTEPWISRFFFSIVCGPAAANFHQWGFWSSDQKLMTGWFLRVPPSFSKSESSRCEALPHPLVQPV